jgi:hypothetical protein
MWPELASVAAVAAVNGSGELMLAMFWRANARHVLASSCSPRGFTGGLRTYLKGLGPSGSFAIATPSITKWLFHQLIRALKHNLKISAKPPKTDINTHINVSLLILGY